MSGFRMACLDVAAIHHQDAAFSPNEYTELENMPIASHIKRVYINMSGLARLAMKIFSRI